MFLFLKFKYFISIILFVWAFSLNAQTNNFFSNSFNLRYHFDKNGQLLKNPFVLDFWNYSLSQISDFKGRPLLYSSILSDNEISHHHIFKTINNDTIKNGSFFSEKVHDYNFSTFLDTNKIMFLGQISSQSNSNNLVYSIISPCPTHKSGLELKEENKKKIIQFDSSINRFALCRDKLANTILVVKSDKYFYSFLFNSKTLEFYKADSFYYPYNTNIPDSIKYNPFYVSNENAGDVYNLKISNSGSKIVFSESNDFITKKNYYFRGLSYRAIVIKTLDFDKETGKFSNLKTIELERSKKMGDLSNVKYFDNFIISPNDSFLYYTISKSDSLTGKIKSDEIVQYNFINNDKNIVYNKKYDLNNNNGIGLLRSAQFKLNHQGEIFFFNDKNRINKWSISLIKNINENFNKLNFEWDKWEVFNAQYPYNCCTDIYRNLYDYLRTDHSISYDCKATVQIKNNSQPWIGFTDFKWHILNDKGQEELYTTKEPPTLTYTKNGDYYIKLFGYSPRGKGYGEWYIDTIKVRIPPKPVANFYAQDSIVCRYKGLQFNNYSSSLQSTSEEYLWTFGDGNTSTNKNPTHQYTKTGVYTVTLHYKNGYCDSTLTKNQYITVVDAPKPGFTINTTQVCSPLNIIITDTVKRHVSAKDYFISDGSAWVNIPNGQTQLRHTFTQAGRYRAVQRLTGFTGCVTMSDSVWIHVSQGLTLQDTLDVKNATVNTIPEIGIKGKSKLYNTVPGNAFIQWQKQAGAVNYQVSKDGSPYAQTTDTFFKDTRLYTKDATYTVQGIDSCGNKSSVGSVGKPVFLQTNLQGKNEAVVIQYSPYLDLPKGSSTLHYSIEKLVEQNGVSTWQNINQSVDVQSYTDQNMKEEGVLQYCYRIAINNNSDWFSYSNVSCSPLLPIIFIPTGFSPNDDGVNDVYQPLFYGIQSYQLTVFNRWGEQVFLGTENQSWTGENAAEGVYKIAVQYRLNTGVLKTENVMVTLLR